MNPRVVSSLPRDLDRGLLSALFQGDRTDLAAVGGQAYREGYSTDQFLNSLLPAVLELSGGEGAGARWSHALTTLGAAVELADCCDREAGWSALLNAADFLACVRPSRQRSLGEGPAADLSAESWLEAFQEGRWAEAERSLKLGAEPFGEKIQRRLSRLVLETSCRLDRQWGHAALVAQAILVLGDRRPDRWASWVALALRSWASGEGDAFLARQLRGAGGERQVPGQSRQEVLARLEQGLALAAWRLVEGSSWSRLHAFLVGAAALSAVHDGGLSPHWPEAALQAALDRDSAGVGDTLGNSSGELVRALADLGPSTEEAQDLARMRLDGALVEACRCEALPAFGHPLQLAAAVARIDRILEPHSLARLSAIEALVRSQDTWLRLRRPWLSLQAAV